jgi:hypothetical protein
MDLDVSNLSTTLTNNETNSQLVENVSSEYTNQSEELSDKLIIDYDEEKLAKYSFHKTVQAPLILNKSNDNDTKAYADIHLSINIFLPKTKKQNSVSQIKSKHFFFR